MSKINKWRNHADGYGLASRILHWVMAFFFFIMFPLGKFMEDLEKTDALYVLLHDIHAQIGLMLFILLIVRVAWKLFDGSPDDLPSLPKYARFLVHKVHFLLYLLFLFALMSGYIVFTANGNAIPFWPMDIAPLFESKNLHEIAGNAHEKITAILMILVIGHLLMALKHHFFDKDSSLTRMLKG